MREQHHISARNLVAAVWGAAEATILFFVPDILLSFIAVHRGSRAALVSAAWATGGALLGGAGLFLWAAQNAESAIEFLNSIPVIHPPLIERAAMGLEGRGLWELFVGAFTGVPYKIYVVQAAAQGVSLILFLLISIPARALRFVIAVWIVSLISRISPWSSAAKTVLLGLIWVAFYLFYFSIMSCW